MLASDAIKYGSLVCGKEVPEDMEQRPSELCLDTGMVPDQINQLGIGIQTYQCHFLGGNQLFIYTRFREIRHLGGRGVCLTAEDRRKPGPGVKLKHCVADFHHNITAPPGITY